MQETENKLQLINLIDFNGIRVGDVIDMPDYNEQEILKLNNIKDNRQKLNNIYKTLCIRYQK